MRLMTLVLVLVFSGMAHAVGPAGCGLGNVIFGNDNQVLASTTNGSSGNQTFGILSGTSNCVESSKKAQLESFVEANTVALNKEAARGEGETLASLNEVLGCKNNFAPVIREHYKQIFANTDAKQISQKIFMVQENNLSRCGI